MMPPAFASTRFAGGFLFLLVLILLSPILVGKSVLAPREVMYESAGLGDVYFSSLYKQIYTEKSDIDIAFVSSSRMECAINQAYVQDALSEKLGRPAVVRKLNWSWNGFDALYFVMQDLLKNRKVKMLVFCDLSLDADNFAHKQTSYWFRWADNSDSLQGLPFISKLSFYSSAIVGIPRNLVDILRHNPPLPPPVKPERPWHWSNIEYNPVTATSPADVLVYSKDTRDAFEFSTKPLPELQAGFVRKIGELAERYHTRLVYLHVPIPTEQKDTKVKEPASWPDVADVSMPLVGIPPVVLFSGMSKDDVGNLYFDSIHFNQNGQRYFTRLVTPTIIQLFEDESKP
jgi:hypothetical protein